MSALLGNYYKVFLCRKDVFQEQYVVHTVRLLFEAIPAFI